MKTDKIDCFGAYITNKSHYCGLYDFPEVSCLPISSVDYICLYDEVRNYRKTPFTAVGFFVDDYKFDRLNGLYYAIASKDQRLLAIYKRRFSGCAYVIAPDYSCYRDMPEFIQIWNIGKSRIVFLWLLMECGLTVIPMAGWGSEETLEYCFDGISKGSTVAISLKGAMDNDYSRSLAKKAIAKLVDCVAPSVIVVYAVCSAELVNSVLASACAAGIKIIYPSNLLRQRNIELRRFRHGRKWQE